jgi:hypothetical protein
MSPALQAGAERVTGGKWIAVVSERETARTLWRGKRRHPNGDEAVSEAFGRIDAMATEAAQ